MKYTFYITNHGFGHAARNVPIIKKILETDTESRVFIKTDDIRCNFLRRNLIGFSRQIYYYEDCRETGLLLKDGTMQPDIVKMKYLIKEDFKHWDAYIDREARFLREHRIDIVITDIIPWALQAANICNIPSILIGNFNWAEMYKSYYEKEIWGPYSDCYHLADKAIWYEIHAKELHGYCKNYECVSLISRAVNKEEVKKIKARYTKGIIFVSLGASAEIKKQIYVGGLPWEFLTTRGVKLVGENVHMLPDHMINTPDYIAASDYIIAKGGWSTIAEILLQKKRCALLFRGENSEDHNTKIILESRRQCVGLEAGELQDMETVIKKMDELIPESFDVYKDDTEKICSIIITMAQAGNASGKHSVTKSR